VKIPPKVSKAFKEALKAQKSAYAPYSNYQVGAALISFRGNIYAGCNVENSSFGATICAERTAILKSVSDENICLEHMVVVTKDKDPAAPCGNCLQMMAEFFGPKSHVWLANQTGIKKHFLFKQLLTHPFGPKKFKK
jgi:cytidine deaminase